MPEWLSDPWLTFALGYAIGTLLQGWPRKRYSHPETS